MKQVFVSSVVVRLFVIIMTSILSLGAVFAQSNSPVTDYDKIKNTPTINNHPCSLTMGRSGADNSFTYFYRNNTPGSSTAWHNNTNTNNCNQGIIGTQIGTWTTRESSSRDTFRTKNNVEFTTFFQGASYSSVTDYDNVRKMQAYIGRKCAESIKLDGAIGVVTLNAVKKTCDKKVDIDTSGPRCDGLCSYDFWKINKTKLIPAGSAEVNRKYKADSSGQTDRCAQHDQKKCYMKITNTGEEDGTVVTGTSGLTYQCETPKIRNTTSKICETQQACVSLSDAKTQCEKLDEAVAGKTCISKSPSSVMISICPDISCPSGKFADGSGGCQCDDSNTDKVESCPGSGSCDEVKEGAKGNKCVNGKEVCDSTKRCCGIQLNTNVPFVGNCIEYSNDSGPAANANTTRVNVMNAFPRLMRALMNIVFTVILIGSFLMIIVGGVKMTNPDNFGTDGSTIIWNVITGIVLLGLSGIILNAINPNFFR